MRGKLNTDIRNHGMVEIRFASMFLTCNLKKESVKYLFSIKVKIDSSKITRDCRNNTRLRF